MNCAYNIQAWYNYSVLVVNHEIDALQAREQFRDSDLWSQTLHIFLRAFVNTAFFVLSLVQKTIVSFQAITDCAFRAATDCVG